MPQTYVSPLYEEGDKYSSLDVPIVVATPENFDKYGRFVEDFDKEEVWIETWPQQGWRPIAAGTGNLQGVREGDYTMNWNGDLLEGHLRAVGHKWIIGRRPRDVDPAKRTHMLVWDVNYHPDGGQVFCPLDNQAFIALVALPTDDIKLEDFKAFYFDGQYGVQLRPNVWHTGMLPKDEEITYRDKQGAVFACARCDTIEEFGKFLRVPLTLTTEK